MFLLVPACGDAAVVGIGRVRESGEPAALDRSIAERFFLNQQPAGRTAGAGMPERTIAELLNWDLPEGWQQLPAKEFRSINLKSGAVECYVSVLTAGGLVDNINRWCRQMQLPALSSAEAGKLERVKIFGREAHLLDCVGDYTSFFGDVKQGYRMRAVYGQFPQFAMSVKMIGPDAEVMALDAGFRQFLASLGFDRDKARGMGGASSNGGMKPTDDSARKIQGDVPAGWSKSQGSGKRYVSFDVGGGAQCYISFLSGPAGGVLGNVNRWLGQIGKAAVDLAFVEKMPRLAILGGQSAYLSASGASQGVLATYTPLPGETMFVKLTGPKDAVQSQVKQFEAYCRSLRNQ